MEYHDKTQFEMQVIMGDYIEEIITSIHRAKNLKAVYTVMARGLFVEIYREGRMYAWVYPESFDMEPHNWRAIIERPGPMDNIKTDLGSGTDPEFLDRVKTFAEEITF
jgi:hypothetical protein